MEGLTSNLGSGLDAVFINITLIKALAIIFLGFIGGTLSGFLGSGGAFIMTPGMMNLGVPGIIAVGTNITHKFGKALVGSRSHGELGHVDKKLALMMLIGLLAGVRAAVKINSRIFESLGKAASNLYISIIFIIVLTSITIIIIRDIKNSRKSDHIIDNDLADKIQKINLPPVIQFEVARIRVSLWFPLIIAFATGYLAGTIGVGGFIGVPAMIYMLGINTRVAAGTELFLAIFSGAWGAIEYAQRGYVDLRLVVILYLGSLIGVQLGAIATEIVDQSIAKLVLVIVIASSDLGRVVMIPEYLRTLGYIDITSNTGNILSMVSTGLLFGGAILGMGVILKNVKEVALSEKKIKILSHAK